MWEVFLIIIIVFPFFICSCIETRFYANNRISRLHVIWELQTSFHLRYVVGWFKNMCFGNIINETIAGNEYKAPMDPIYYHQKQCAFGPANTKCPIFR